MIVCGMEMAASEARLVILNGMKASFIHVDVNPPKLVLVDDENSDEIKAFKNSVYAFLRENAVEKVVIKKRSKRGEYAGGPIGFKLEAIVQLFTECPVTLVSPQSIAAAKRNHSPDIPQGIQKYREAAFETAFTELP